MRRKKKQKNFVEAYVEAYAHNAISERKFNVGIVDPGWVLHSENNIILAKCSRTRTKKVGNR